MKIRLSTIPYEGIKINDFIPLESINNRLKLGHNHGIEFSEPPKVEVTVYSSPFGAETKGKVYGRYLQPCSRCDEPKEREAEVEANFILKARPVDKNKDTTNQSGSSTKKRTPKKAELEEELNEDDVGLILFDGDHIDLQDAFEEALILSLSIYWQPELDAKGGCNQCGVCFMNEDNQSGGKQHKPDQGKILLGELLQKARHKKPAVK